MGKCIFLQLCEVTVDPCLLTSQCLPTSLNSKISISENYSCPRKKKISFIKCPQEQDISFWSTGLIFFPGMPGSVTSDLGGNGGCRAGIVCNEDL